MPDTPDFFREFGILPYGKAVPPVKVRASFSRGTIIGQYIATALMSGFGLGITILFFFTLPFPFNLLAPLGTLAAVGVGVYYANAQRLCLDRVGKRRAAGQTPVHRTNGGKAYRRN